jgi:hypothetical protein
MAARRDSAPPPWHQSQKLTVPLFQESKTARRKGLQPCDLCRLAIAAASHGVERSFGVIQLSRWRFRLLRHPSPHNLPSGRERNTSAQCKSAFHLPDRKARPQPCRADRTDATFGPAHRAARNQALESPLLPRILPNHFTTEARLAAANCVRISSSLPRAVIFRLLSAL